MALVSDHALMNWHLEHNHIPGIVGGEDFAFACIEACNEGDPDRIVTHIDTHGGFTGRAGDVIEGWHLEEFVESDDDEC